MSIFDKIQDYGDNIAVICDGIKSISYNQLTNNADVISEELPAHSLILVINSNCYASIAGYVGFLRKGAVPLMLPADTTAETMAHLTEAYQAEYVFAPLASGKTLGLVDPVKTLGSYGLYKACDMHITNIYKDLSLLLPTSGSTGSPSFVRLSAANIASNAAQIADYLHIKPGDRAITTMPMSYSYGLSIINSHLMQGATIVATEAPVIGTKFWRTMTDTSVTTFGGVPFIFEMLKKLRFHKMTLPHLRTVTQAGGKLSAELTNYFLEACQGFGAGFYVMYGQTEATARMTYMPPNKLADKPASVGIPIPNSEIWLENQAGERVTTNSSVGELVFKGPNVSLGTAENRADLALGDKNNGVLHTGDLVTCDKEGFVTIVGRKKRFLKIFGNRVNLDEVETLLSKTGFSVAVAGVDDKMSVYVEIGTKDEKHPVLDSAKTLIKSQTKISPRGFKVIALDKIPRTDSGKISYHLLNTEFAAK
jgi:long-chain acyl-CoA synthetase